MSEKSTHCANIDCKSFVPQIRLLHGGKTCSKECAQYVKQTKNREHAKKQRLRAKLKRRMSKKINTLSPSELSDFNIYTSTNMGLSDALLNASQADWKKALTSGLDSVSMNRNIRAIVREELNNFNSSSNKSEKIKQTAKDS